MVSTIFAAELVFSVGCAAAQVNTHSCLPDLHEFLFSPPEVLQCPFLLAVHILICTFLSYSVYSLGTLHSQTLPTSVCSNQVTQCPTGSLAHSLVL